MTDMSMLSAQCDELRSMADSVGLAMPQAATLMMEAADTILSLRDRAQDLQAENAKLRDENQSIGLAAYELGRNSMADENAKLRKLAVLNWEWAHSCCGNNCKMQTDGCGYQIDRECNYEREIYDRMCELGMEADE